MTANARALERIEQAMRETPICPRCAAPTTVAEDAGRLWLVCSAEPPPGTGLAGIVAGLVAHERHLVLDPSRRAA